MLTHHTIQKLEESISYYFPELLHPDQKKKKQEEILEWCYRKSCHLFSYPFSLKSESFLSYLNEIPRPPKLLFILGELKNLPSKSIAIVGTRTCSLYGIQSTGYFSSGLAKQEWNIVSGLAKGIDATAHRTCLQVKGITTAVLAHGLDLIYPKENHSLACSILENQGCLISEYPPGVTPRKYFFPARNRLISGLSQGVLVIEAGLKSGAILTAQAAVEQNKEVFVLPGNFHNPNFLGNHHLIQQGAKLVTCISDLLEEFPYLHLTSEPTTKEDATKKTSNNTSASFSFTWQDVPTELKEIYFQFFRNTEGISTTNFPPLSSYSFPQFLFHLEEGKKWGFIYEPTPQFFIWIGPSPNHKE